MRTPRAARAVIWPRSAGLAAPARGRRRERLLLCLFFGVVALCASGLFLPAPLVAPEPTPIVYDRNGAFLAQIGAGAEHGYWPLRAIPARVALATLALEDRRFFSHPGVEARAVLRAAWRNVSGRGRREGASTIAMQVARMQAPAPRSFGAKLMEAATALALISRHGHEAVLAHYLRLAPYGNGSHGVAHAARFYFDKPVEDLSLAEIALLAAVPQSPGRMNLFREHGLTLARARAARALAHLREEGAVDAAQVALAERQLATLRPIGAARRLDALHLALRYESLIGDGAIMARSKDDPRIHASIDLSLQERVAALARRYLSLWRGAGARQAAVMVVERGTGAVLADVGSSDYRDPREGAIDFTRVQRSPGSTLKPFVYALAFERDALRATDIVSDIPEGASGVDNADGLFLGPMLPRQALANSRNVPATNLLRRVGLEANFRFLHDLRLHDLEAPAESFGVAMAIGALPTRLERLVAAYGALAEDGVLSDLVFATEQTRRRSIRVMSTDTARLVTSMLADPLARLPSFPRYGPLEYPFAVAVKTGTSQGYRDAWTIAFSRKAIVGVWLGRGDAGVMNRLSGAASAARLAHAVLAHMHGAKPGDLSEDSFPAPEGRIPVEMCLAGGANGGACNETLVEWVKPHERPAAALAAPALAAGPTQPAALAITTPEHRTHIWRNPEQPAALNRLALKASATPSVGQILWYVDGEPFALAEADAAVYWPMRPGTHRIQARAPMRPEASRIVEITVE
ncbi:transglycosylase domain-containing protein [Methylosinus sp. Sm6]|uniref:transglycosylase domain-containing protein n=1 Tax=Methylosinus sp. Sm6 TaxID=2866948 RepID=UPI001C9900E6|nr:transglycosylase domain-containing protein [Methylosinus sp. Sm6]MBY6241837.1 transglycosylase domain-containing protein [Methylosinus sp. Sm6]